MQKISEKINALDTMQHYPDPLYYKGDIRLLQRKKIAIVGSRKPNQYARNMTQLLARKLSQNGVVVVSGGAIGVDAIAHKAAGSANTIMVAATGLQHRYPAINKNIICAIETNGLVLSQFPPDATARKYHFVLRNELVVALGDVLIVTYADANSGTLRSIEYAKKMGKKIYVLPHRIGESEATNALLASQDAEAIYDIDAFCALFADQTKISQQEDSFIQFCATFPTYEEVLKIYPKKIFEAELQGVIEVKNGRVYPIK